MPRVDMSFRYVDDGDLFERFVQADNATLEYGDLPERAVSIIEEEIGRVFDGDFELMALSFMSMSPQFGGLMGTVFTYEVMAEWEEYDEYDEDDED